MILAQAFTQQGLDPTLGFPGDKVINRYKFERPISELREIVKQERCKCDHCGAIHLRKHMIKHNGLYDTPWDTESKARYYCSTECENADLYEGDFSYFLCLSCVREICEQNPANGWHIQYRTLDAEMICLSCYEQHILKHGVSRDELEAGKLPGMFFSSDNHELVEAGFELYSEHFVQGDSSGVAKHCLSLMDEGKIVVISYERLAYGGGEGDVAVWVK